MLIADDSLSGGTTLLNGRHSVYRFFVRLALAQVVRDDCAVEPNVLARPLKKVFEKVSVPAIKTNHMPVRFLIYVAITALTRLLISDVSHHNPPDIGIIYLCGGILLLAFAILVVRYASSQYPSVKVQDPHSKTKALVEESGES
jgi:hypothetical protein